MAQGTSTSQLADGGRRGEGDAPPLSGHTPKEADSTLPHIQLAEIHSRDHTKHKETEQWQIYPECLCAQLKWGFLQKEGNANGSDP